MTQVRLALSAPTSDGTGRRPTGTLEWRPTMRRDVAGDVILPAPFTVGVGTDPPPVIDVDPTEPGWAWAVVERVQGGSPHKRLLLVPDVGTVVDYADLVEVDPATLDPVTLSNAWWTQVTAYAQPLGDYATNTALTSGLAGKQDKATLGADVAADATVRAAFVLPRANSLALAGDSRQAQNGGYPIGPDSPGFAMYDDRGVWTHLIPLIGQRLKMVGNWGVGGYTTANVLANLTTPLAAKPGYVADNSGINDLLTSVPLATIKANKTAIFTAILAAGATPIIETIPTSSSLDTDPKRADRYRLNNWLRAYVQNNPGCILLDHERALTNPTTGDPKVGTTFDGLHYTQKGAALLAAAAAPTLIARVQALSTVASANAHDPDNLLANPLMLPIGGAFPTSWLAVVGGSDIVNPVILDHPDQPGAGWLRVTMPATKYLILQASIPDSAVVQGQELVFQIEVEGGPDWSGVTEMGARVWYLNSSNVQLTNSTSHFHRTGAGSEDPSAPGSGSTGPRVERQLLRTPPLAPPVGAVHAQAQLFFGGGGTLYIGRASARINGL